MNKSILFSLNCAILIQCFIVSLALATPADEMVQELNAQVLRVEVNHHNGSHGFGSAVVIAKNQVVTSCHVVNDAQDVTVTVHGNSYVATEIKPDWYHDLCILTVANLQAPIAKMGDSKSLKVETSVFTVGYPDKTTQPVNTFGVVKEFFPMDNSAVIRATSPFRLGASGGGVFDDAGSLVGIITLKSRGNQAYYYYMPVEWVQALMSQPTQALGAKNEKPFWAASPKQRPYFMQIVQPYTAHDWQALLAIAHEWVNNEPNTDQSWFYLAMAEYEIHDFGKAEEHLKKVLALNESHIQAIELLHKITERAFNNKAQLNQVALSEQALLMD